MRLFWIVYISYMYVLAAWQSFSHRLEYCRFSEWLLKSLQRDEGMLEMQVLQCRPLVVSEGLQSLFNIQFTVKNEASVTRIGFNYGFNLWWTRAWPSGLMYWWYILTQFGMQTQSLYTIRNVSRNFRTTHRWSPASSSTVAVGFLLSI